MANSVTVRDNLTKVSVLDFSPIQVIEASFDSSGDLTIKSGVSGKSIYVVGFDVLDNDAINPTFKSGSGPSYQLSLYFGANSGKWEGPTRNILFPCAPGEDLIINNPSAIAWNATVYLIQTGQVLNIR